ncbi:MAG: hypothetical protein ACI9OD_003750 [Limisphaerales bacterium]|jgi:hypothetical protein
MNRIARLFSSDNLNPVVVREMRQLVRGNWITFGVTGYLVLLFLVCVSATGVEDVSLARGQSMGTDVFGRVFLLIFFAVVVLVTLHSFDRTASELKVGDWDMMYSTPLSAMQIVSGKMLSAFIIGGLFVSVCMPFMFTAVLLRGVDYMDLAGMLITAIITLDVFTEWAIFIGCIQLPRWGRIIIGMLATLATLAALFAFGAAGVIRPGGGSIGMAVSGMIAALFCHAMACVVIAPNRKPSWSPPV